MENKKRGPVHIAGAIILWAVLLWFFTINNPGFVPAAKAIFTVLVVPLVAVEWVKMKGLAGDGKLVFIKILFIAAGFAAWYFYFRK